MASDVENTTENNGGKLEGGITGKGFKKGFDSRRWVSGRPKKPKDLKAAEELVQHVIWEELSREITDGKGEAVDALRLMIRSMIRNKTTQKEILERIAGKVTDRHELTGKDGEPLKVLIEYVNNNDTTAEITQGSTENQE